jgi:hypothetical protein
MGREKSLRLGRMRAVYARSDRKPPDHCAAECLHSHGAVSCPGHAGWRPLTPRPAERRIRPWCPRERSPLRPVGFEDLHTSARETSACLLGGRRQLRAASDHYHSVVIAVSALFGDERLRASRRWRASTVRGIGIITASCRPPMRALTTRGICIFSTDSTSSLRTRRHISVTCRHSQHLPLPARDTLRECLVP